LRATALFSPFPFFLSLFTSGSLVVLDNLITPERTPMAARLRRSLRFNLIIQLLRVTCNNCRPLAPSWKTNYDDQDDDAKEVEGSIIWSASAGIISREETGKKEEEQGKVVEYRRLIAVSRKKIEKKSPLRTGARTGLKGQAHLCVGGRTCHSISHARMESTWNAEENKCKNKRIKGRANGRRKSMKSIEGALNNVAIGGIANLAAPESVCCKKPERERNSGV
jgi:hypothetical protein